jgi:hypothetical protein
MQRPHDVSGLFTKTKVSPRAGVIYCALVKMNASLVKDGCVFRRSNRRGRCFSRGAESDSGRHSQVFSVNASY